VIFDEFFAMATGVAPFPYQQHLAEAEAWPDTLEAPTGSGKTEALVLAWLWRRREAPEKVRASTPRRLAYCLPMRVLVEQTRDRVQRWLQALGLAESVGVHVLMGGEEPDAGEWDLHPERDVILIGTQDMLLSRALNRGYAMGRSRWPLPFGLLNNDCQWVFDEVQLMGSGLATSAQLAAFRSLLGAYGTCRTTWVSATLRAQWLATVDHRAALDGLIHHTLSEREWSASHLSPRLNAVKRVAATDASVADAKSLAVQIRAAHQPGTLTLVVVNTVERAAALYRALQPSEKPAKKRSAQAELLPMSTPELVLLHSRMRPPDRAAAVRRLLAMQETGGIAVSTQVVEAGVDISARVLFTELAPWASLVQRFGRCNRRGEFEQADVFWIDVEGKYAAPYEIQDLNAAREQIQKLADAGPRALRHFLATLSDAEREALYPYEASQVLRRRTLEELFDTTADLSGADIDVSPYIRDADEHDVYVFWRAFDGDPNDPLQAAPARDELCPVSLNKTSKEWLQKKSPWRWDFLDGEWQRADGYPPGSILLLPDSAGGYSSDVGFDVASTAPVMAMPKKDAPEDGNEADRLSTERPAWQTLAAHTDDVVAEMSRITQALAGLLTNEEHSDLLHAARWHDRGKAHPVFQKALTARANPEPGVLWAKSAAAGGRYRRRGFRHELASALAMIDQPDAHSALACFLVAAHHGKVRVSIRSMPGEKVPPDGRRFARGIWHGDELPAADLGGGVIAPAVTLSLAPMDLGWSDGQPSWATRALALRDELGPFRLAYLEALLCAADRRASARASQSATQHMSNEEDRS
jgi:CRISPR-associated endonuclease/helicase Cas3